MKTIFIYIITVGVVAWLISLVITNISDSMLLKQFSALSSDHAAYAMTRIKAMDIPLEYHIS